MDTWTGDQYVYQSIDNEYYNHTASPPIYVREEDRYIAEQQGIPNYLYKSANICTDKYINKKNRIRSDTIDDRYRNIVNNGWYASGYNPSPMFAFGIPTIIPQGNTAMHIPVTTPAINGVHREGLSMEDNNIILFLIFVVIVLFCFCLKFCYSLDSKMGELLRNNKI